eukprot:6867490-Prymnesium_polylepis.1
MIRTVGCNVGWAVGYTAALLDVGWAVGYDGAAVSHCWMGCWIRWRGGLALLDGLLDTMVARVRRFRAVSPAESHLEVGGDCGGEADNLGEQHKVRE